MAASDSGDVQSWKGVAIFAFLHPKDVPACLTELVGAHGSQAYTVVRETRIRQAARCGSPAVKRVMPEVKQAGAAVKRNESLKRTSLSRIF